MMLNETYSVHQLSCSTGMTARAIRLYDERGLVRSHRNRLNHRRFSKADAERLALIKMLRTAGVSLEEIAGVLAVAQDGGAQRGLVSTLLQDRLEALRRGVAQVEDILKMFEPAAQQRKSA